MRSWRSWQPAEPHAVWRNRHRPLLPVSPLLRSIQRVVQIFDQSHPRGSGMFHPIADGQDFVVEKSRITLCRKRACRLLTKDLQRAKPVQCPANIMHRLPRLFVHRPGPHQTSRGRDGEAMPASSTARMPVKKMPSKVPAPPIEATGAPSPLILSRLSRSAPMSVPMEPPI